MSRRVNLAAIVHLRRQGERLAAAAGAEIEHLLARLRCAEQRGELRALVLYFDKAFDEGGLRIQRRGAAVGRRRDAQTELRERRRLRIKMRQRREHVVTRGFQPVDAKIDRRAFRQRAAFCQCALAKRGKEMRR